MKGEKMSQKMRKRKSIGKEKWIMCKGKREKGTAVDIVVIG